MSNYLPRHVAIIMDGNGRWARRSKLARIQGHRAGVKAVEASIKFCIEKGIQALTLFAFGLDNRFRPKNEVEDLMLLFLESLRKHTDELNKNNVRVRIMGDYSLFGEELLASVEEAQSQTSSNTGLQLVIAINYSGRWDIVQAIQNLNASIESGETDKAFSVDDFSRHLCLSELPEPDLLIRTSGEQRLSNFMLWQLAYTELFFTDVLWPDFNAKIFLQALEFFQSRERRFGLTSEQVEKLC